LTSVNQDDVENWSPVMSRSISKSGSVAGRLVEPLEGRRLLSGTPVPVNDATEFQVNVQTAGPQEMSIGDRSVATDAQGNFVVAWHSINNGVSNLYARRYDAAGNALGGEIKVNTQSGVYSIPSYSVAMNAGGSFVVVWRHAYTVSKNTTSSDVHGQRFDPAGSPVGGEFVASSSANGHSYPTVGMADDGSFVVAWMRDSGSQKEGWNVYGQRFAASGAKVGAEFRVNDYLPGEQGHPSLATDGQGNFLLAWQSPNQDGSDLGVYAKRYNATGAATSGEFRVNVKTSGRQNEPSAALLPDGGFVAVWQDLVPGVLGSSNVRLRRFDASGVGSPEQVVNTHTAGDQDFPKVAADAQGNATVVWWDTSGEDGSGYGVFGQQYDSSGQPSGSELQLNSYTNNDQGACFVAAQPGGKFVAVWDSYGQDGDMDGVFARLFQPSPATTSAASTSTSNSLFSSTAIASTSPTDQKDQTSLAAELLA
jgi:hypothetical protein